MCTEMHTGLYAQYPLLLPNLDQNWNIYKQLSVELSNTKCHKNSSGFSTDATCRQTDRQTWCGYYVKFCNFHCEYTKKACINLIHCLIHLLHLSSIRLVLLMFIQTSHSPPAAPSMQTTVPDITFIYPLPFPWIESNIQSSVFLSHIPL